MLKYLRIAFSAIVLLLAATDAAAVCLFGVIHEVYVGDTASDSSCTYNSIQDALNASYACSTTIRITREHTYTSQHLTLNGTIKPLALQGEADGVTCYELAHCPTTTLNHCHDATTQPLVTIDGSNTSGSVLTITGSNTLTLRDLTITRGSADASVGGGGIQFDGTGSLALDTTTVSLNYAGYGGGINVNGNGGPATLTLDANSLVINNTAEHDGGGIRLTGQARLFALQPYTLIGYNHADNGHGGGVYLAGPAMADIGSPGYNGAPVIEYNTAAYGGGIGMDTASDAGSVTGRIFSTDAHNPVQVSNNTASHTGGGIWMHPFNGGGFPVPIFCAFDFRIDNNIAQEGTAIYSDTDYSDVGLNYLAGYVYLNHDDQLCSYPDSISTYGAVRCAPGVACNTLNNNTAEDSSNDPKPGAVILLQDGLGSLSGFHAERFAMRGNTGGHAIRAFDISSYVQDCLIADNADAGEVIRIENDGGEGDTTVTGCTIVNNKVGSGAVIYSPHQLTMTDSIIDEPGIATLSYSGGAANLYVAYMLATDTATLPAANGIDQGEPDYVDAADKDYHLKPTSIGVDFAPANGGNDLDGNPRDVDLSEVPNVFGPRDIGAYELQYICSPDTIYCNGFDTYQ